MTPKEKADELVKKFIPHTRLFLDGLGWTDCLDAAKCCALKAVDEIVEEVVESADNEVKSMRIIYWEKVKQEINNL